MALGYLVMGLVADLVADIRHCRSKLVNSLSYLILSLGGGHQRLCGPLRQREIHHRQAHHFLLGRITADSVYVLAHLHRPRHDEGRAHHSWTRPRLTWIRRTRRS